MGNNDCEKNQPYQHHQIYVKRNQLKEHESKY